MNGEYLSDATEAIHETMEALHDICAISDLTMSEFDDECLVRVDYKTVRNENPKADIVHQYL